jgi:Stage II sporulation protein E (SpoIIE)
VVPDREGGQHHLLTMAVKGAGLSAEQLWLRYFTLGGSAGLAEIEKYLSGLIPLGAMQRDLLALAVNERLDEISWAPRAPYSRPARDSSPASPPLAALVELLDGTHLAPPERLPAIAAGAARALGAQITIYLVDYDQKDLIPLPSSDGAFQVNQKVDSTLAGRAFRLEQIVPAGTGDSTRLWLPLLDGAERLGVVEVVLPADANPYDPGMRTECRWLAALIGHLVVATTRYGDGLDDVRRLRRRSPAAELIWKLLPPLTAGTEAFTLAGMLEPCYEVGGDAFDYSLSETTVSMAVFDAAGHTLSSGFIAAAAIAAYRSARHAGRGLYEQAQTIDDTIAGLFDHEALASGFLAELDLTTGRLRYLNAGHPLPYVLRSGKVVKSLVGGQRGLFGLGSAEMTVAEETLQPQDWLVLHTDGVTEARDSAGNFFGDERLIDFLEREAASGHPPPETVRRLVHAVMNHQGGVLQDDATVLLACWAKKMA